MDSETKTCQNCKQNFTIEPEDFAFYEKVKVPPPTWCPECRLVRRLAFMNERAFHWRDCDLCKRKTLSVFSPEYEGVVYCQECWWSDKWDATSYGLEIDFSRPFLEQFYELTRRVPAMAIGNMHSTLENSEFVNQCSYLKNCYLLFNSDYNVDCAYSSYLEKSSNCFDLYMAHLCEATYAGNSLYKDYKVAFSDHCNECTNVWFSKNCIGCSDCFGCINLRNKRYYIFNKQYTKEEYLEKLREFKTSSHKSLEEIKKLAYRTHLNYPRKFMQGLRYVNSSGDSIFNSKNAKMCYDVGAVQDCKYCHFLFVSDDGQNSTDSYDYTMWGLNTSRMYECMGCGNGMADIKFSNICWASAARLQYTWYILVQCEDLFGCVALKNKKYCILNKQYTKEEYEDLLPKIMKHIDDMPYTDKENRVYKYGEFLPPEFATFPYNESIAQKYFPKDKPGIIDGGYNWREPDTKTYPITLKAADLPDDISAVENTILDEVIECEHAGNCLEQCTVAFKLIESELEFYRAMNLPLPRKCHNCRHYEILREGTNPIHYYDRACMCDGKGSNGSANNSYPNQIDHFHGREHCPNKFITTYAPDRPEIVYCEQCYNAEVV